MSNVTARVMSDVAGRGMQAIGLMDMAFSGFFDALETQRAERVDAVSALVAELGRARRVAVAAQAEAARLRQENATLVDALARSRAAVRGYAQALDFA